MNEENSTTINDERQGEEVRSFIRQLNTWVREDLDTNLKRRLDFSTKAIEKLVRVFDKFVFDDEDEEINISIHFHLVYLINTNDYSIRSIHRVQQQLRVKNIFFKIKKKQKIDVEVFLTFQNVQMRFIKLC